MFKVLRPVFETTKEVVAIRMGREIFYERITHFVVVGNARDAEDARKKFSPGEYGYGLILEEIGE